MTLNLTRGTDPNCGGSGCAQIIERQKGTYAGTGCDSWTSQGTITVSNATQYVDNGTSAWGALQDYSCYRYVYYEDDLVGNRAGPAGLHVPTPGQAFYRLAPEEAWTLTKDGLVQVSAK